MAAILIPTALAANPLDLVAAPLQQNFNISTEQLEKTALEHISQGNLTQEHIIQDINTTTERLKTEAAGRINQSLNISAEQLEQRAKEELKNQLSQKVQQPGFEFAFALIGILGMAFIFARRN